MMEKKFRSLIVEPVREYLEYQLSANDLVRIVDEAVAKDVLHGFDFKLTNLVDNFHEALALYVADDIGRKEELGVYIDELTLREKAIEFDRLMRLKGY